MSPLNGLIERLPQKPPFVFLDEIIELEPGRAAVATKVFPRRHVVFDGHLPDDPMVPGVILIEALAQLSGIVLLDEGDARVRGYLAEVAHARFRRLVRPDERIVLRAELERSFGSTARLAVSAEVEGEPAAEGVLTIGGMKQR